MKSTTVIKIHNINKLLYGTTIVMFGRSKNARSLLFSNIGEFYCFTVLCAVYQPDVVATAVSFVILTCSTLLLLKSILLDITNRSHRCRIFITQVQTIENCHSLSYILVYNTINTGFCGHHQQNNTTLTDGFIQLFGLSVDIADGQSNFSNQSNIVGP